MKTILIFSLLLFSFLANAKKYKLNYEPSGIIIKFQFDSMVIYTDTASLISLYDEKKAYDLRVINYIRKSIRNTKNDTVLFVGENIPFKDSINNKYEKDWYIEWAILHLIKNKKIKLIDKYNQQVNVIKTKRIGSRKKGYIKRSYINKATGDELFKETLFVVIVNPSF